MRCRHIDRLGSLLTVRTVEVRDLLPVRPEDVDDQVDAVLIDLTDDRRAALQVRRIDMLLGRDERPLQDHALAENGAPDRLSRRGGGDQEQ